MTSTIESKPLVERVVKPGSRWRNRYRARIYAFANCIKARVSPGQSYEDPRTFPSKEIAEQKHSDWHAHVAATRPYFDPNGSEYLGAFPVSDQ